MSLITRFVVAFGLFVGSPHGAFGWHPGEMYGCGWSHSVVWLSVPSPYDRYCWNGWFPNRRLHRPWCGPQIYSSFRVSWCDFGQSAFWISSPAVRYRAIHYSVNNSPAISIMQDQAIEAVPSVIQRAKTNLLSSPAPHRLIATGAAIERAETDQAAVPSDVLAAADAIFSAGGYSEAARAYARLAVRYGVSDALTTRRFVALVASNDCEQAAAVLHAALVGGAKITAQHLPQQSLDALYGTQASNTRLHCEIVAKFALERSQEAIPLMMVGKWLELQDQGDRARAFFNRAADLDSDVSGYVLAMDDSSK